MANGGQQTRATAHGNAAGGGRRATPTILRWIERFGVIPNYKAIAGRAKRHPQEVAYVFSEQRHTQTVQDAVASVYGLSTEWLFGDAAWCRVAAKELAERQRIPA